METKFSYRVNDSLYKFTKTRLNNSKKLNYLKDGFILNKTLSNMLFRNDFSKGFLYKLNKAVLEMYNLPKKLVLHFNFIQDKDEVNLK
jgi:hypothetical protein